MQQFRITIAEWLSRRSPIKEIPLLLFCATSLQLAFLHPYVVIVPGERANLFSGLLCAVTLAVACLVALQAGVQKRPFEVQISVVLGTLMVLSGLGSQTPGPSSARGFVVLASGLGGFWCARILLATESRRRLFVWFSIAVLGGILLMSLISYRYADNVYHLLDPNPHPLATRILLLWFAPLSLLLCGTAPAKIAAAFLMIASYLVFYLSELRSAVLIPVALCILAVMLGRLRLRYMMALFISLFIVIVYFLYHLPELKMGKTYEPTYYRAENYPFSLHIALKHPFFGIGIRAPREEFFNDYDIKYPYVARDTFLESVSRIRSSENIFLTIMAEVGFPFLILYNFSLAILLRGLVQRIAPCSQSCVLPPFALLLPLSAALIHCLVFDALLHPQVCWFFHILLGLIPLGDRVERIESGKKFNGFP